VGKSKPKPSKNGHATEPAEPPKACYVLSLEIENVRCFGPKQTLDLSDGKGRPAQWTIILGENGVGKTTLLQVLVGFEQSRFLRGPRLVTFPWVERYGSEQLSGYFRLGDQALPSRCAMEWLVSLDVGLQVGGTPLREEWSPKQGTVGHVGFYDPNPKPRPQFIGYGASRRLETQGTQESDDDAVGTLFDSTANVRNAEEWFLSHDHAAVKNWDGSKDAAKRRDLAKNLLIGVLPDVTDIRFNPGEGMYPRGRVEFETPYGWVPLRRLGYGYQTLIAWVTDLVSRMAERYPDSPDPLKEPAIVVVDEIDLHLHPTWQRKLISFLTERFPNTQFIATAHSPLVVQAAANANLAVLKRVGDHVEIHNDVDQIRGWRVDQILTSELFGLSSARPPEVEKLFERKQQLLAKKRLSADEKDELARVNADIAKVPTGETAQHAKEMDAIRKALELLQKKSPA
jgi:energy-coupling factor transporter ATP-binding protein EcfA2